MSRESLFGSPASQPSNPEKERIAELQAKRDNHYFSFEERYAAGEELLKLHEQKWKESQNVADKIDFLQAEQGLEDLTKDRESAEAGEMDLDFTKPGAMPKIEGIEVTEVVNPEVFDALRDDITTIKRKIIEKSSNDSAFDKAMDASYDVTKAEAQRRRSQNVQQGKL